MALEHPRWTSVLKGEPPLDITAHPSLERPTAETAELAALPNSLDSIPDWSREHPQRFWDPGRRLLRALRKYQTAKAKGTWFARLWSRYHALQHCFWSAVSGAEIPLNCEIGGGLLIPHPNGIVIHSDSKIGANCILFQQVTLGSRTGSGVPVLGCDVLIGAGAKILGNVTIGDHARIGANAVVVANVPAGASAAGVPAVVLPRSVA